MASRERATAARGLAGGRDVGPLRAQIAPTFGSPVGVGAGDGLGAEPAPDEEGLEGAGVGHHGGDRGARERGPHLFPVPDRVVGAEGDEAPVGGDLGDAALHHLLHVERVRVHEVLDDDHEGLLGQGVEPRRRVDPAGGAVELGQAAVGPGAAGEGRGAPQALQGPAQVGVGHDPVGEVVEVVLDVDEAGEGDDVTPVDQAVGDGATGGEAARDGDEVRGPEPLGALGGQAVDDIGVGHPVERVEGEVPARVGDGLEGHAAHGGVAHPELHDGAEFVLVDAPFDGGGEDDGEAVLGAAVEGGLLGGPQVAPPDG